ncbi:MAG: hypothetical protein ABF243_07440 [Celeribacter marinus]
MTNPFENRAASLKGAAADITPVTPDDLNDLPHPALALYVETAGAVCFTSIAGHVRTVMVGDFAILPVATVRVLATGTTATGIHAFTVS